MITNQEADQRFRRVAVAPRLRKSGWRTDGGLRLGRRTV